MISHLRLSSVVLGCAAMLSFAGCSKKDDASSTTTTGTTTSAGGTVSLNGAGATFPNPLYTKWISDYSALPAGHGVKINYQSIGSGGGIKAISDQTVDFGATDAPLTDEEASKAPGKLLHIPTTLGAVVLTYNLDGIKTGLKLSPDIKSWDDPKIKADNAALPLPKKSISIVHRTDGSGTTEVFTQYLAQVSPDWKTKVGAGKSVKWPTGNGAKGNEGVTGNVSNTPGSIGYVELAYAAQNNLAVADLKNHAGKFVSPSLDAISAAAAAMGDKVPDDLRMSILDPDGDASYPISSFTYILLYAEQKDAAKGAALVNFLWWGIHDGQKAAPGLHYAPLPAAIVTRDEAKLKSVTSGGKAVLAAP
jgi:phosphate transport system substrate-binding protein